MIGEVKTRHKDPYKLNIKKKKERKKLCLSLLRIYSLDFERFLTKLHTDNLWGCKGEFAKTEF